jgi:hypothetical protein
MFRDLSVDSEPFFCFALARAVPELLELTNSCGDQSLIRTTDIALGPARPPFGHFSVCHTGNCQQNSCFYSSPVSVTSTVYCSTVYHLQLTVSCLLLSPFANVENDIFLFR